MPGALVGLGAGAVAAVGIMKDDRALAWGGTLVGWSVLGLIRLDRALNPQLRAARQREAAAEATWIDVRRQMNRWESAGREWGALRKSILHH
jgi:hypothetical protein